MTEGGMMTSDAYDREIIDLSLSNRKLFLTSFAAVQVPGLIAAILMAYWTSEYKGGFVSNYITFYNATPNTPEGCEALATGGAKCPVSGLHFNWHPLLLTIGLIFLYGNGALVYRVFPSKNDGQKFARKMIHATVMILAFLLAMAGLAAAFDSHNLKTDADGRPTPIPNMYTLHSWVGLTAVILFAMQWLLGFSAFLYPKFSSSWRRATLPFHQYFGSAIFVLAVAAALMGLLEKAIWSIGTYNKKGTEALLVNFMGILFILFGGGVSFLLSKFKKDL